MSGLPDAADGERADGRHRAREAAVQMLYQWEVGRTPPEDVVAGFFAERRAPGPGDEADHADEVAPELSRAQQAFAADLVRGVAAHATEIDPVIAAAAQHWRLERMAVVDRLILRLAVYEFQHRPETPARVVINEALELARTFSTEEAVRFVNGLLDGVRKSLDRH
ncbi:MAG: transcription antitermination factor NusB [Vicinamibacterales bacterium]